MRHTGGWVKLYRKLGKSWIAEDGVALAVFDTLLRWANREPSKAKFEGKPVIIEPGQILTSSKQLSDTLKFDRKAVERRLWIMTEDGVILRKVSNRGSIITLVNWEAYQGDSEDVTIRRPSGDQQMTFDGTHNGELKKRRIKEEERVDTPSRANPSPVKRLANLWNEFSGNQLPKVDVESLTSNSRRYRFAQSRLREKPDLDYWQAVIERIASSSFCRGDNDRGWKANFEFLVRSDSHVKVMEGNYDDKSSAPVQRDWEAILS